MDASNLRKEAISVYVGDLFRLLLHRKPSSAEQSLWMERLLSKNLTELQAFTHISNSYECKEKHKVASFFYEGHYHSPVVDPSTVDNYLRFSREAPIEGIPGLDDLQEKMVAIWNRNKDWAKNISFRNDVGGPNRYHYLNSSYPHGDAITLYLMLNEIRPKRIIEIGSGFSTACMLDAADDAGLNTLSIGCIEPVADRLRSALRPEDSARVTIHENTVQEMALEFFDSLENGDLLFIDSTHVMKTGSDVHFELFYILPRLKSGVYIHIHDCAYPFEYNDIFIKQRNYSWNEIYAVRAFLMYNNSFEIVFWSTLFALQNRDLIAAICPAFLKNTGSSLWLRKR
jgi:hypothetical protein